MLPIATTHQEPCYPMQSESIDIQEMYWPEFASDSTNAIPLNQDGTTSLTSFREDFMDHANSLPSPRISDICTTLDDLGTNDRLQPSPPSAIRNLASLNIALCECAENLPCPSTADLCSAGMADNGECDSRKTRLFAIDELFRITTCFIDVVQCLSLVENETSASSFATSSKQPAAQSLLSLDASSQGSLQGGLKIPEANIGPQSRSLLHLDSATKFMVASCHCRLTEIYISLFRMMQACIEHVLAPRMDKDWAVVLPQLQVGSVASPSVHVDIDTPLPSGTSSMYMLMVTMLSSRLCGQLADAMRVGNDVPTSPILGSRYVLADTVWDTVRDGTDRLLRIIEATKHLLRQHSTREH